MTLTEPWLEEKMTEMMQSTRLSGLIRVTQQRLWSVVLEHWSLMREVYIFCFSPLAVMSSCLVQRMHLVTELKYFRLLNMSIMYEGISEQISTGALLCPECLNGVIYITITICT